MKRVVGGIIHYYYSFVAKVVEPQDIYKVIVCFHTSVYHDIVFINVD